MYNVQYTYIEYYVPCHITFRTHFDSITQNCYTRFL